MMSIEYAEVEKEYARNGNLKQQDIQFLQEWLKKQFHLPPVKERELILFLKSCLYSIEKAKITIDNYFTLKSATDLFPKMDLNRYKVAMETSIIALLPKLTSEGYQILYVKVNRDVTNYVFADHISYLDGICKIYLLDRLAVEGLVCIIDLEEFSFAHLTKIPLSILKKYLVFLQEALPIRLVNVHFINSGSIIDKIFALIKPFLKKELLSIMHVHSSNLQTLHELVPKACLSKDLGGEVGLISEFYDQQKQMVIENFDFLKQDERIVDESKREDTTGSINNMFGVQGSFKKLDID